MLLQGFNTNLQMSIWKSSWWISKSQKVDLKMSKNEKRWKIETKISKMFKSWTFWEPNYPFLVPYDLGPKKWLSGFFSSENNDAHCVYIDFHFSPFIDKFKAFQGSPYCIKTPQNKKIRPPNPNPATIIYKSWPSCNNYSQNSMLPQELAMLPLSSTY